jgi:hypothetical protein
MITDKSAVLAAERLEPYTAAEHAAAEGRQLEYARDVPHSCVCTWQYSQAEGRYVMIRDWPGCPWHTEGNEGNR